MIFKKQSPALLLFVCSFFAFSSFAQTVSVSPALNKILGTKELKYAHVGVYVFDDSSKKEIENYQSDKYFVPASNTKLFSLYAGMKFLGDSILGLAYKESDTAILIDPTGDPTFLHPDFLTQPVFDFLKKKHKKIYVADNSRTWLENPLGAGWSWDDYNDDYNIERSQFPVYGNFIRWTQEKSPFRSNPAFEATATVFSTPEIPWPVRFNTDSLPKTFLVKRNIDSNVFTIHMGNEPNMTQDVPFVTNNLNTAIQLLRDTLGLFVNPLVSSGADAELHFSRAGGGDREVSVAHDPDGECGRPRCQPGRCVNRCWR